MDVYYLQNKTKDIKQLQQILNNIKTLLPGKQPLTQQLQTILQKNIKLQLYISDEQQINKQLMDKVESAQLRIQQQQKSTPIKVFNSPIDKKMKQTKIEEYTPNIHEQHQLSAINDQIEQYQNIIKQSQKQLEQALLSQKLQQEIYGKGQLEIVTLSNVIYQLDAQLTQLKNQDEDSDGTESVMHYKEGTNVKETAQLMQKQMKQLQMEIIQLEKTLKNEQIKANKKKQKSLENCSVELVSQLVLDEYRESVW
ncbi:Hypothetical_protein [Hexamita inflata]|uniref:Hypothetical_protein n=1 Tax=Hexamita inflata TaxID=28002 RepID=A0AA86QF95_9EUKA|nr:Hypothetical protein HINF_LOCUS41558 [Hexamita inflata]